MHTHATGDGPPWSSATGRMLNRLCSSKQDSLPPIRLPKRCMRAGSPQACPCTVAYQLHLQHHKGLFSLHTNRSSR